MNYLLKKYFVSVSSIIIIFFDVLSGQNIEGYKNIYRDNMRIDTRTNVAAAMYNINSPVYQGMPEQIAKQFLNENKEVFGISDISDLCKMEIIESPAGKHVGFLQTYKGIPVYGSETVVSINKENRVTMVMNGNSPVTGLMSTTPNIKSEDAINQIMTKLNVEEKTLISQPYTELYIYLDSIFVYHLTWKIIFTANKPNGNWQAFVDANSGEILKILDISMKYVNGTGKVFKPDPITSLQNTSLTDQDNADYAALQNAYQTVTLNDLNDPVGGNYYLQGRYVRSEEIESPTTTQATNSTPSFLYNRSQVGFEEVNIYYFIDLQRRYIGGLGFNPQWNGYDYIRYDAHGFSGQDNSKYNPSPSFLAFGDGGIDDGEDQDVILHEYGHALHDALMSGTGTGNSDEFTISEGLGDYMALSYRLTLSSFQPNKIFPWDGNGEFNSGRSINSTYTYPANWTIQVLYEEPYDGGTTWASTMMDIQNYGDIGRDVITKLHLASFSYVTSSSKVPDQVQAIFQADKDIYNSAHLQSLGKGFYNRGFFNERSGQYWPSPYDHPSNLLSGDITSSTTWGGIKWVNGNINIKSGATVTLSGDAYLFIGDNQKITVESGGTLSIQAGARITSYSNAEIDINSGGTLNASGSSGSPIIFTGSGWNGIKIYSSNITMNYCKIKNASCGIYIESASPTIQNTWINYCGTGMSVYGGGPTLTTNTIYNNSGWGLNAYVNANVFMGYNKYNIIGNCSSGGIQAYANATVYATQGYNSIYLDPNSGSYRVAASDGGNVQASYSYWGSCPTTPSWFYQGLGGTINHSDSLCSDPNSGRSLYKQASSPIAENAGMIQSSRPNITSVDDELSQAYKLWQTKQYSATIDKCKSILSNVNIASNTYFSAISLLRLAGQETEQSDIEAYLQKTASTYERQEFGGVALSNYVQYLMFKNRYQEALDNIVIAVNKYKNSNIEKTALFQKILVLYNHLNDTKKADAELSNFETKYPNDLLTNELKRLTNRQDQPGFKINTSQQSGDIINISEEIKLSNYPNPFNPSTTINYRVTVNGQVILKIYDITGREVTTLVNGYKENGNYSVIFNAEKLSSGTYYCRLIINPSSGEKNITNQKMMQLLK